MSKGKDIGNIAKTITELTGKKPDVIAEKDSMNYLIPQLQRMYSLIQPYQQTVQPNNLVFFNSNEDDSDDAYWLRIIDLYNNASSTFSNLVDLRRNMLVSDGLMPVVPETDPLYTPTIDFLNQENEFGESLQDIWYKIAFDYSLMETYFLELLYNQEGKIANIIHLSPTKIRAVAPENSNLNYVNLWNLSNNFGYTNKGGKYTKKAINGIPVANYNKKTWAEDGGRQILNCRRYSAGNNFYAIPSHNSILSYAELQNQLSIYALGTVSNSFTPTCVVFLAGNPDKKMKDEFVSRFKSRYSTANGEKILFIWSTNAEEKPQILPFNTQDVTPMIEALQRISIESICSGFGASIELAGVSQGVSLQTDMNRLTTAYNFYQHARIKPLLSEMLKTLNKVFRHNELSDVKIEVSPLKIDNAPAVAPVEVQPENNLKKLI